MVNGLSEKLRLLRENAGFSQRNVAQRLGGSPAIISAYENGERTPSVENLLALSYLYKCSTDYLLGKSRELPQAYLDVSNLTEQQRCLLASFLNSLGNHKL